MDGSINWGMIGAVVSILAGLGSGFWAVHSSIQRQFERSAEKGEARTVRTHDRIAALEVNIATTYVTRSEHAAEVRRIDDRVNTIEGQTACAGVRARNRSKPRVKQEG
jgi:hypothetical protein